MSKFTASEYTSEELEWIRKKTLMNMVLNYREELLKLHRTKKCNLTENIRGKLRDYGLIDFHRRNEGDWYLTPKCLELLLASEVQIEQSD